MPTTADFPPFALAGALLGGVGVLVDTHILEWTSMADVVGLHTAYELDRKPRWVHLLSPAESMDRRI